jgi:hypothetical protein
MQAEVKLTDGTMLKTEQNVGTDELIRRMSSAGRPDFAPVGFIAIHTATGETFRVNPLQIVYLRDVS